MKFLSLEPFVPSGKDFEKAKQFFQELGFLVSWDAGDYTGFVFGECRFILQKYDEQFFAENFMLSVKTDDVKSLREQILQKDLPGKYGVKISALLQQPYGLELNVIDMAGVCWHFVQ
ncbi:MAG: bleomycin resistance protein [Ferruginibacter sp.]|nr:bleomycin resistance protein [Ferruginibacter sp.]